MKFDNGKLLAPTEISTGSNGNFYRRKMTYNMVSLRNCISVLNIWSTYIVSIVYHTQAGLDKLTFSWDWTVSNIMLQTLRRLIFLVGLFFAEWNLCLILDPSKLWDILVMGGFVVICFPHRFFDQNGQMFFIAKSRLFF